MPPHGHCPTDAGAQKKKKKNRGSFDLRLQDVQRRKLLRHHLGRGGGARRREQTTNSMVHPHPAECGDPGPRAACIAANSQTCDNQMRPWTRPGTSRSALLRSVEPRAQGRLRLQTPRPLRAEVRAATLLEATKAKRNARAGRGRDRCADLAGVGRDREQVREALRVGVARPVEAPRDCVRDATAVSVLGARAGRGAVRRSALHSRSPGTCRCRPGWSCSCVDVAVGRLGLDLIGDLVRSPCSCPGLPSPSCGSCSPADESKCPCAMLPVAGSVAAGT